MHFCDEVIVTLTAGKGGNGCVAYRREKFVPRGGPDGGDGGDGGSLFLEVDANRNTLAEFNMKKIFRAKDGESGGIKKMHGKNGETLILKVPPGTLVFDAAANNPLADLKEIGERFCIARGGKGGFGNAHFSTSTRQTPSFAEKGEPGQKRAVRLELKLVADVGVIGLPSVGKSSFIARVSAARPKIADYPFTTLVPNLGVCYLSSFGGKVYESFVVCDIPGLIEGAHQGKGLGIEFLKHIMRNRVLLHLLDGGSKNIVADYETILEELRSYDPALLEKPQFVAINKIDILRPEEQAVQKKKILKAHPEIKKDFFQISCATGAGLEKVILTIYRELQKIPKAQPELTEEEYRVFRPTEEENPHAFEVRLVSEKDGKKYFEVRGQRIEQIAVMTNFRNPEAVSRVYDVLHKMGIQRELTRLGAHQDDEITVAGHTLIFYED